ncbi:MAG: RNA polymerase sigma factor [Roseivirga sp.]|nr:RNA polymerase sigma factor [Roseivirga sp.]
MPSDQELVRDFLDSQSEAAFRRLYRDKTPHLYQMALRLTAFNEFEADELVQKMWIIAIRKLNGFTWKSTLKTWLTGILINLNRDELKKEASKKKVTDALSAQKAASSTTISGYDLEKALSNIPIGYRKVIILHDIEGYQHKEIAALLNINEGTSKSQLFQARKALRQQLTSKDQQ